MANYTVRLDNVTGPDVVSLGDGTTYATLTVNANSRTPLVADPSPELGGDLNLNGNDITGTGDISITGSVTATSADINGGTIDGTVIGGTTPAAGNFTTGSFTGNATFGDNDKAIFGAGSDLQIYHDGAKSVIHDAGTGNLLVRATNLSFANDAWSANYLTAQDGGGVTLYYDNSLKLATTSTGIDVTGTVTADGLTVDGAASAQIVLNEGDTTDLNTRIINNTGKLSTQTWSDAGGLVGTRMLIDHATGDISFYEDTGTTPKFFWDASAESLGIGTSSLSGTNVLHLYGVNSTGLLVETTSAVSRIALKDSGTTSATSVRLGSAGDGMEFITGGSSHMRIDSSGNLLVGTTVSALHSSPTESGARLYDGGIVTAGAGTVAYFNRNGTGGDGTIIDLRKDGTNVGSIGVENGYITVGKGDTGLKFQDAVDSIIPHNLSTNAGRDNAIDLGFSATRFDDIYATNGTIQTSDRNEKQDIDVLSDAEQRVAVACKGLLRKFRWKDAVAEKGDDARIHFGIIAQDLQDAFAAEGLDAGRYAMFISSTWWEATETYTDDEGVEQTLTNTYATPEEAPEGATERTRLGVRYPELLAFIIAAI